MRFANLTQADHYVGMESQSSLLVVCRNLFREEIVGKGAEVLRQAVRILTPNGLLLTDGRSAAAMSKAPPALLDYVLSIQPAHYLPERDADVGYVDPAVILSIWRRGAEQQDSSRAP